MYIQVDLEKQKMAYHDSATTDSRSCNKGKDNQTILMNNLSKRIDSWALNKLLKFKCNRGNGSFKKVFVEKISIQYDTESCGFYALFFMDCVRNWYKIRQH